MLRHSSLSILLLLATPAFASDASCFHSAAEAASGAGVQDSQGFYLVVTRLDALTGVSWAAVARCGRPDLPVTLVRTGVAAKTGMLKGNVVPAASVVAQPAVLNAGRELGPEPKVTHVRVNRLRPRESAVVETAPAPVPTSPPVVQAAPQSVSAQSTPLILAGKPVRVVWEAGSARGELVGLAMANGAAGQSVKVRMAGLIAGAEERIVSGTVRADGTLTLEAGR